MWIGAQIWPGIGTQVNPPLWARNPCYSGFAMSWTGSQLDADRPSKWVKFACLFTHYSVRRLSLYERTELAFRIPLRPGPSPSKRADVKRAGAGRTSKWTVGRLCVLFGRDRNREKKLCHSRYQCPASSYLRAVSVAEPSDLGKVLYADCFPHIGIFKKCEKNLITNFNNECNTTSISGTNT